MARIPTSGATVVTPHLPQTDFEKALQKLCPDAELSASVVGNFYGRLAAIIGRWAAEQQRMSALSVARALTKISKNVTAATAVLSAHQTGYRDSTDIEILSQLKIALAANPRVGSLQKADELISSKEDTAMIARACLIAARNLKTMVGKSGRPQADWHDDFTALLLDIAKETGITPNLWKDQRTDKRGGWLFEAARKLELFLNPDMVTGAGEATGKRLERSKQRLAQHKKALESSSDRYYGANATRKMNGPPPSRRNAPRQNPDETSPLYPQPVP
jgi:hypothetical protein